MKRGLPQPAGSVRFGPFRFDPARRTLTRDGRVVPLQALPARILAKLIEAPGLTTTREELKAALWPRCERIDTERRLNTGMRALRAALGEDADRPRYIQTFRGTGYRWMGRPDPRPRLLPVAIAAGCAGVALFAGAWVIETRDASLNRSEQAAYVAIAAGVGQSPSSAQGRLDAFLRKRPDYGPALALRAGLSASLWRESPSRQGLGTAERALRAARRKLGDSSEFDLIEADLELGGHWNAAEAERLYRRALAQDPASLEARKGLAWLYLDTGRPQLALAEAKRATRKGDLDVETRADLGWLMLRLHREDLALGLCTAAGRSPNLLACRHTALERRGDWADARAAALDLMTVAGADARTMRDVGEGDPREGYARFLAWRADVLAQQPQGWFQRAQLQASAGRADAAISSLQQAWSTHDPDLLKLNSTAEFATLRKDPRYIALAGAVEREVWL